MIALSAMTLRLLLVALVLASIVPGRAQENVVVTSDGAKDRTTPLFNIADKWEVRWSGASAITITIVAPDGSIVAGTSASADGSLYQPKGGMFYLQISGTPSASTPSWHVAAVALGASATASTGAGSSPNYAPPAQILAPGPTATATTASTPPATNAPAASGKLTDAQAGAIVLVKGDNSEGTGFLVHMPDGPGVITNIHVVSDNPNVKVTTNDGRQIPILGYKGAADRDLMMLTIKDDHYSYLDLATDVDNLVHVDDSVITPGNSEGGEVMLDTDGTVRGVGPQKVEFSNPVFHGNSGGPVLHVGSSKVIAVVEGAYAVNPSDALDRASLADSKSAIVGSMRYFGLRLDTVPKWEPYDWNRFLAETIFLRNFHEASRGLDSVLNGSRYERANLAVSNGDEDFPSSHYFLRNDRLKSLMEDYHQRTTDVDKSEQMDVGREIVSDLQDIANADMDVIQRAGNFYSFDQTLAKREIEYRSALKKELDNMGDHLSDLGH
jgi:S1-C subfamily serine protease